MSLVNRTISIDREVWDLAQRLYPRGVSRLLNEYLSGIVNAHQDLKIPDNASPNELQTEIEEISSKLSHEKLRLEALQAEHIRRLKKAEEAGQLRLQEIARREKARKNYAEMTGTMEYAT